MVNVKRAPLARPRSRRGCGQPCAFRVGRLFPRDLRSFPQFERAGHRRAPDGHAPAFQGHLNAHAAQAKARWAPKVGRRIPLGSQRARPVGGPSQMVERGSAANLARRLAESHGPVPRFDRGSGGLSVIRSSLDASKDLVALSHPRQSTTSRGRSHQGNRLVAAATTGLGGCRERRVELVILPEGSPSPRQNATRALLCGRPAGWPRHLRHQGVAEC